MLDPFGQLADGTEIVEATITAGELTAKVLNFGAVIRDLRLSGVDHPLVLGLNSVADYVEHSPHFGAVAGRCANRIAGGRFILDGTEYQLTLNEDGRNHLHGGFNGFGIRPWRVVASAPDTVTLAVTGEAGEDGYPGRVEATCRYTVMSPASLRVELEATTSAATPVNLAQHTYFNLSGADRILDHQVRIEADAYTPVDDNHIPTGEIRDVSGTDFDFRTMRPIRRMSGSERVGYDTNFVIAMEKAVAPRPVARLQSPDGGLALDIASTEPGLQFYDASMLGDLPVPGLDGRHYGPNAGCCFEPQFFPDAVNHPGFPSAILRPGETYRQTTQYDFSRR